MRLLPLLSALVVTGTVAGQARWQPLETMPPRHGGQGLLLPGLGLVRVGGTDLTLARDAWRFTGTTWEREPIELPETGTAVYDAARNRIVLAATSGVLRFWEFDGFAWTLIYPPGAPSLLYPTVAYDSVRGHTLIVGQPVGTSTPVTWSWNGAFLLQRAGSGLPAGSKQMAFDRGRGRMVLLPGLAPNVPQVDVYEWDGASWQRITSPVAPPWDFGVTLGFDPVARGIVLGGTQTAGNQVDLELWDWDGAAWSRRSRGAGAWPSWRQFALLTEDPAGRLLVVGGADRSVLGDTWAWDGAGWTLLEADRGGPPRTHPALAAEPLGLLLFGGFAGQQNTTETWRWRQGAWSRLQPSRTPPPQLRPVLAADPGNDRVLLWDENAWLWAFANGDWQRLPAFGPGRRVQPGLAADTARGVLVLYGGNDAQGPLHDTWEFDGQQWQQRGSGFPPVDEPRLVFDVRRGRSVLVGTGLGVRELWEWDGQNWHSTAPPMRPPVGPFALCFDELRDRTILLSGGSAPWQNAQTWEWDGLGWTMTGSDPDLVRLGAALGFDPGTGRVLNYGGQGPSGATGRHGREHFTHHPARYVAVGTGCADVGAPPSLRAEWLPWLGDTMRIVIQGLPDGPAVLNTGVSTTVWRGIPLPAPLDTMGFPGCTAYAGPDDARLLVQQNGAASSDFVVPPSPALTGLTLAQQVMGLTLTGALVASVGAHAVLGRR